MHSYLGLWGKAWGVWLGGWGSHGLAGGSTILRPWSQPHSSSTLSSKDPHLEGSTL